MSRNEDQEGVSGQRDKVTILLVDDDASILKLIAATLEDRGFRVIQSTRGTQALELCKVYAGPIHVLVTDYSMPGMTGAELLAQATSLRPRMKVLCLTGHDPDTKRIPAHIPRLAKPFDMKSLLEKIRELGSGSVE